MLLTVERKKGKGERQERHPATKALCSKEARNLSYPYSRDTILDVCVLLMSASTQLLVSVLRTTAGRRLCSGWLPAPPHPAVPSLVIRLFAHRIPSLPSRPPAGSRSSVSS